MVHLALKPGPAVERASEHAASERRGPLRKLGAVRRLAFSWLLIAALLALADALVSCAVAFNAASMADRDGIRFNAVSIALASLLSITIGHARPDWWRRAIVSLAVAPVLPLLVASHNVQAGAATFLLVFVASWLGREIAARGLGELDAGGAWVIGATFGLGLIAASGFALGTLGLLRPYVTWPALLIAALALCLKARPRLWREARDLARWAAMPAARQPLQHLLAGAALACFWLNLLGALTPELRSDAVRQRLPTAAQFARNGTLQPVDPDLYVATEPALGEIAFATLLTLGPIQGAKLLSFLVGLACAGTVFALGKQLGGPLAGGLAAFAYYSTLLTAYLSQTTYLDQFTTLFALAPALILTQRRGPSRSTAIASGLCIGLGVATKLHFGYVAIGLAFAAGLIALRLQGIRYAVSTVAILNTGAVLAAAPWFFRSFTLTGAIPGLALGAAAIATSSSNQMTSVFDLKSFGFGRSPQDLLALPFTTTLASSKFGGTQLVSGVLGGHVGYLPLAVVPLVIVARPHWRMLSLLLGMTTTAILWFYTAQYLRYALPMFAIFCAIGAAAYVRVCQLDSSARRRVAMQLLIGCAALSGLAVRAQLPDIAHRYAFGFQDRDAFLTEYLGLTAAGSYPILHTIQDDPGATRVLALFDGARLYSRVRISTPYTTGDDLNSAEDEAIVLQRLRAGGYSHIMVDRRSWMGAITGWDQMTVLSEGFLRRHTVLVAGGDHCYLYRLLSPAEEASGTAWAQGHNLLDNGDFESQADGHPAGWELTGRPSYDRSGGKSSSGQSAIRLKPQDTLAATVSVRPGMSYLVGAAAWSEERYNYANVRVEWRDSEGQVLTAGGELIPTSPRGYQRFSLLVVAPQRAATAVISIRVAGRPAWVDDISFQSILPDMAATEPAAGISLR